MSFALEPKAPVSTRSTREHYLDALRAGLMLVDIPYHAAYVYTGRPWFVACSRRSQGLRVSGNIIHLFRMQAFFLVAGLFAAHLLVRRTPGAYLKGRLVRLGTPLIAVAVLVNPMGPIFHQIVPVLQEKEKASAPCALPSPAALGPPVVPASLKILQRSRGCALCTPSNDDERGRGRADDRS